jgi:hypothetical protein
VRHSRDCKRAVTTGSFCGISPEGGLLRFCSGVSRPCLVSKRLRARTLGFVCANSRAWKNRNTTNQANSKRNSKQTLIRWIRPVQMAPRAYWSKQVAATGDRAGRLTPRPSCASSSKGRALAAPTMRVRSTFYSQGSLQPGGNSRGGSPNQCRPIKSAVDPRRRSAKRSAACSSPHPA